VGAGISYAPPNLAENTPKATLFMAL
jgi:hypothetical protein